MRGRGILRGGSDRSGFKVVIAGGGVAALEAALALRKLARDRVHVTVVAPNAEFVYKPVAVLEPFAQSPPRRLPLEDFAADAHAAFEQDGLESVDADRRVVHTTGQRELPYDALLVAVGARSQAVPQGATAMDFARLGDALEGVIGDIDSRAIRSVAFVAPAQAWPLPAYEVALLMRERARSADLELGITIVTQEPAPLAVFGDAVSDAVAELLAEGEIKTVLGASPESVAGGLEFDRVLAVPALEGPAIAGLPADGAGFLPITSQCEVAGSDRVYAAGDATDFPVKFGGIAAQQADAAATQIAALAGATVEPAAFEGTVHGSLQAGWKDHRRLYFSARFEDGKASDSRASETPTSSPDAKIAARYLGPYLDNLWAEGLRWIAGQLAWEPSSR
jgi:sulfide:quinone oxidoreductase